jgi:hypothetical protein
VAPLLAALLLAYAYRSLKETIEQGLTAPKPKLLEVSADHLAAAAIASSLHGGTTPGELMQLIRDVLAQENARLTAEAEAAREEAAPDSRIETLRITPNPAIAGKSALL